MGKQLRNETRSLALGGIFGALALAIMELGAVIPVAMFIAPALAGLLVMFADAEAGPRMAATLYLAISLLSVILVSDKEVPLVFIVILGYWPLVQAQFDRIHLRVVRAAAKLAVFNLAISAMLGVLYLIFPMQFDTERLRAEQILALATLLIGNISFLLYDRAMVNLRRAYTLLWKPRLHKLLGIR